MSRKCQRLYFHVLPFTLLEFERKPIQSIPTCAMCGKPVKDHTTEEIKKCANTRRNVNV